jgi:hypothetical protein
LSGKKPSLPYAKVHVNHQLSFEGIPQTSTLYWKALQLSSVVRSEDQYLQAYKLAGRQFRSKVSAEGQYILVHFRGPDDNTPQKDEIPFCTREAIHRLLKTGIPMRTISNNYTHTMKWLRGLPSIEIVHLGTEFSNLQLVLNAVAIVQHAPGGWSAFTSVPAMSKSIPLINTYNGKEHRFSKVFAQIGKVPQEFYSCAQMEDFIEMLPVFD